MKRVWKTLVLLSAVILLLAGSIAGWLYLYTADLPSTALFQPLNPTGPSTAVINVRDSQSISIPVVSFNEIGMNLINAVIAAEGTPDDRNPLSSAIADLVSKRQPLTNSYSWQIARRVDWKARPLRRQVNELRLANQIQRRFTKDQILTIYLNGMYFGPGIYGVASAAQKYYGKEPSQLSVDEAAVIAVLIRAPSFYSPIVHPDRATQRRNAVLDEMVLSGTLEKAEAERAKATDLHVKANGTT